MVEAFTSCLSQAVMAEAAPMANDVGGLEEAGDCRRERERESSPPLRKLPNGCSPGVSRRTRRAPKFSERCPKVASRSETRLAAQKHGPIPDTRARSGQMFGQHQGILWATPELEGFAGGKFPGRLVSSCSVTFGEVDELCHHRPLLGRRHHKPWPASARTSSALLLRAPAAAGQRAFHIHVCTRRLLSEEAGSSATGSGGRPVVRRGALAESGGHHLRGGGGLRRGVRRVGRGRPPLCVCVHRS